MSALRAVPTLFRVGLASAVAYRGEFVVWALSTNMPLVMLALWVEVAREAPFGNFGEREFVAYYLATLIVRMMTGSWVVWEMNQEIREGSLTARLLRPLHPFVHYATDSLSALPVRAVIAFPVAVVALFWAGRGHVATDAAHWVIAMAGMLGAWLVIFSAMLAIGALGLYWESSLALYDLWLGLFMVFSGYLMPLSFFPAWMRHAADWMPFRYTLAFPVETMLGLDTVGQAARALATQWAWAIGFMGLALTLWQRGLRRYAAYGG